MRTKERLAQDLEKAGAPVKMIEYARNGFYDDYETFIAAPIWQLVEDCEAAGLHELAVKARNGEYDGTKEEGEEWFREHGEEELNR